MQREQPQRVAHEDGHAGAVFLPTDSAEEGGEGDQPEVGLGLATARREPEEVGDFPVRVVGIHDPFEAQQHEGDLERPPTTGCRVRCPFASVLHPGTAGPLLCHGFVGELEGVHGIGVVPQELDALPDTSESRVAGLELFACGRLEGGACQLLPLGAHFADPTRVSGGQFLKSIEDAGVGQCRQVLHGEGIAVDLRIGVREQNLVSGDEFRAYHRNRCSHGVRFPDGGRSPFPMCRTSVPHCERRGVAVEESAGILLGVDCARGRRALDECLLSGRSGHGQAGLEETERVLEFTVTDTLVVDEGDRDGDGSRGL